LICEPKPVHKVGFIRKKGKATARAVQHSQETGGLLHRLKVKVGVFMDALTLGLDKD
jgi:hypothetical protein